MKTEKNGTNACTIPCIKLAMMVRMKILTISVIKIIIPNVKSISAFSLSILGPFNNMLGTVFLFFLFNFSLVIFANNKQANHCPISHKLNCFKLSVFFPDDYVTVKYRTSPSRKGLFISLKLNLFFVFCVMSDG